MIRYTVDSCVILFSVTRPIVRTDLTDVTLVIDDTHGDEDKEDEGERERIYISSQDSIHMFNHSLILIFVSDLRSNMVNTDLLPAAP